MKFQNVAAPNKCVSLLQFDQNSYIFVFKPFFFHFLLL